MKFFQSFADLNKVIVKCQRCPRLVNYREHVPKRASYAEEHYWRSPLPGFGCTKASLLILGLAPSAHGGNRTGRLFTGDPSGDFLMSGLYKSGLANHPYSDTADDGLQLKGCYMTAAVKCAPPLNKPLLEEFSNCSSYLENELSLLKNLKAVLALGKLAFDEYLRFLKRREIKTSAKFHHGKRFEIPGSPTLWTSYHPSPQNTHTGKLTEKMFLDLLKKIKEDSVF